MSITTEQVERQQQTYQPVKIDRGAIFAKYFSFYALALVLVWFASLSLTSTGAAETAALARNSPLLSWAYDKTDSQSVSNYIGWCELVIAVLIALRPLSRILSALGGIFAIALCLGALSLLFTAPGIATGLNFGIVPALSLAGQLLLKDLVLLGVSIQVFADSLRRREVAFYPRTARIREFDDRGGIKTKEPVD